VCAVRIGYTDVGRPTYLAMPVSFLIENGIAMVE
jgi:hypothetical protein